MGRRLEQRVLWSAVLALGALLTVSSALAAPPQNRAQARVLGQALSQTQGQQALARHLDLRAPTHLEAVDSGQEKPFGTFPSMAHRPGAGSEASLQLPALGKDGMHSRPTIQDFVRRVHQEGLPVARLMETKSALLHLGLNPKGKPGLWLVQKTR